MTKNYTLEILWIECMCVEIWQKKRHVSRQDFPYVTDAYIKQNNECLAFRLSLQLD